ncbi:MAG: type II toxin-antitoxin system RelE/ParE family toxin [Okeania sp. SIO3B3]|nr:type II toxin-antitoxin system RelE/ParE family toxin [Okeania sp. SIO3B3]
MPYEIEFVESVKPQLKILSLRERNLIFDAIEEQLLNEPLTPTKNRKLLRPNPLAPWELPLGDLRIFYEVVDEEPNIVRILAIGKKEGNKLFIGCQEVSL